MAVPLGSENQALANISCSIMSDLKNGYAVWEDVIAKANKLGSSLKSLQQTFSGLIESVQSVADLASNSQGGSKEAGLYISRMCIRQRRLEQRVGEMNTQTLNAGQLISGKLEDWRRVAAQLEKERSRQLKRARADLKKATVEVERIQKKATKQGVSLNSSVQTNELNSRKANSLIIQFEDASNEVKRRVERVREVEVQTTRELMTEEHERLQCFLTSFVPILECQTSIIDELLSVKESLQTLSDMEAHPESLMAIYEAVLQKAISDPESTTSEVSMLSVGRPKDTMGQRSSNTDQMCNYPSDTDSGRVTMENMPLETKSGDLPDNSSLTYASYKYLNNKDDGTRSLGAEGGSYKQYADPGQFPQPSWQQSINKIADETLCRPSRQHTTDQSSNAADFTRALINAGLPAMRTNWADKHDGHTEESDTEEDDDEDDGSNSDSGAVGKQSLAPNGGGDYVCVKSPLGNQHHPAVNRLLSDMKASPNDSDPGRHTISSANERGITGGGRATLNNLTFNPSFGKASSKDSGVDSSSTILYPNQALPPPVYTNLPQLAHAAQRKFSIPQSPSSPPINGSAAPSPRINRASCQLEDRVSLRSVQLQNTPISPSRSSHHFQSTLALHSTVPSSSPLHITPSRLTPANSISGSTNIDPLSTGLDELDKLTSSGSSHCPSSTSATLPDSRFSRQLSNGQPQFGNCQSRISMIHSSSVGPHSPHNVEDKQQRHTIYHHLPHCRSHSVGQTDSPMLVPNSPPSPPPAFAWSGPPNTSPFKSPTHNRVTPLSSEAASLMSELSSQLQQLASRTRATDHPNESTTVDASDDVFDLPPPPPPSMFQATRLS